MHCIPRRFSPILVLTMLLTGFSGTTLAQERFVLKVPGRTDLSSSATLTQQKLVITDSQNQTHVYQRVPNLDTPDGRYLGFYSRAAGQAIRWPANDAGSMLIGDANGQNWRESRQQIRAQRPRPPQRPNQVITRKPALDPLGQNPRRAIPGGQFPRGEGRFRQGRGRQEQGRFRQGRGRQEQGRFRQGGEPQRTRPMELAYTRTGNQSLDVGYIGPQGDLQLYRGFRDQWQPQQFANPEFFESAGLLPGAPLQLASRRGQKLPSAYTVNKNGQLIEIAGGNEIRPVANQVQFAPRSHFQVHSTRQGARGYAVDAQGRLWDLDFASGRQQLIDSNQGRFSAGVPISVVARQRGGNPRDNLFLVDERGRVLNYSFTGSDWHGPRQVAAGFPPGAHLAATLQQVGQGAQIRLAGVDARGQVQTLSQTHAGWQATPVRGATLPPGGPVTFTQAGPELWLSGIGPGGDWNHWNHQSGQWNQSVLSRGFLAGAPVVADPLSHSAFSVDATGRLVAGGYWDNDWHSHLLIPGLDYTPRLVRRQIVPAGGLGPATVYFDNPSQEELVVQMVDQFGPQGGPVQFNIPPGGSVPKNIRRDGGGTLEEVYLVPGPRGGWVERVDTFPLPPQPGPSVVVWSKRVTYSYVDPKNISVLDDFDLKNNVSLGMFELPPGEFLEDGDRFNVYQEAVSRRNPGAAQFFGPPIPDADVGVPLYRDDRGRRETPPGRAPSRSQPRPSDSPAPVVPPLPEPEQPDSENSDKTKNSESPETGPALPPLPR